MDSPFPPDLESTLKLFAGLDLIDRNGCKKKMDDMDAEVLEVPDTPDRMAVVPSFGRCSGPSLGEEGIDGEADTSSSDGRIGHAGNPFARHRRESGRRDVIGSSTALNGTDHLGSRARLARLIPKTLEINASLQTPCFELEKTRASNDSGKSVETVDLIQESPFPFTIPTRCRSSRRNNGNASRRENEGIKSGRSAELLSTSSSFPDRSIGKLESVVGILCDGENAALRSGEKGKGINLKSDPEAETEQEPSRPLPQRKIDRRRLRSNNYLSPCNSSKSKIQVEVDGEDIIKSVDGVRCSDSVSDPQAEAKPVISRPLHLDTSQRETGQRLLTHNSYASPCNIHPQFDGQTTIKLVDGETFSSFSGFSNQDDKKKIDIASVSQPKTGQRSLRLTKCNTGTRRLVQNGCTSPYNSVQDKSGAKDVDGTSSHQINIVHLDSEGRHGDKKGKVKLDANTVGGMQHVEDKTRLARVCSTSGKEVTAIARMDDDTPMSSEDLGWRTTRNSKEKASTYSSLEISGLSEREGTNSYLSDQSHETSTEDRSFINLVHDSPEGTASRPSPGRTPSESESERIRRYRRQKFVKGKRRCSSLHFTSGESSSSSFEDSEISYLYSSGGRSKSTRSLNSQRHDTSLEPVIEIDELHSPELRCRSAQEQRCRLDDSSAKANQVESDEILARQLQEQFYDESPGLGGTEEIDANIARSLQEEDARLAAFIARRGPSHTRDTSISHLYGHYPQMSFQNASARLTNRAQIPTSSRMPQLRRNFNSPEMDLETTMLANLRRNFNSAEMDADRRLSFFEALEAAFDNNNGMPFSDYVLQTQRDFNENDYEMLLALDDNNHQHVGASESQINSLPQSVIQSDSIGEACAVCLETPIAGDTIRHLPCLHKFHKECIDTWLRRRASCPICKSGISP